MMPATPEPSHHPPELSGSPADAINIDGFFMRRGFSPLAVNLSSKKETREHHVRLPVSRFDAGVGQFSQHVSTSHGPDSPP